MTLLCQFTVKEWLPVLVEYTTEFFFFYRIIKLVVATSVKYTAIYCGVCGDDLVVLPVFWSFVLNCEIATLFVFRDNRFITAQFGFFFSFFFLNFNWSLVPVSFCHCRSILRKSLHQDKSCGQFARFTSWHTPGHKLAMKYFVKKL